MNDMSGMPRSAPVHCNGAAPVAAQPRERAPQHDAALEAKRAQSVECARQPIGVVLEIAGSGSAIALDLMRLNECMSDADPSIALAGQVGSQIKIKTNDGWLLASVRNQRQDRRAGGVVQRFFWYR